MTAIFALALKQPVGKVRRSISRKSAKHPIRGLSDRIERADPLLARAQEPSPPSPSQTSPARSPCSDIY